MPHYYNTRTEKQEDENNTSDLETKLFDGFSSLKDEVINPKDVIKSNLQEENVELRNRFESL